MGVDAYDKSQNYDIDVGLRALGGKGGGCAEGCLAVVNCDVVLGLGVEGVSYPDIVPLSVVLLPSSVLVSFVSVRGKDDSRLPSSVGVAKAAVPVASTLSSVAALPESAVNFPRRLGSRLESLLCSH